MVCAIKAKQEGNDVLILEKMNSLGKKLLITGKGRCNITNAMPIEEFMTNIPGNSKFLYSCFQNFSNKDIINLIEEQGVKTKVERGDRVFPESDRSQDVLNAFLDLLFKLGVRVKTNSEVVKVLVENGKVKAVLTKKGEKLEADKVVLATGGKSYSSTGSNGDGYRIAEELGHKVTQIRPSLVPLNIVEKDICKSLQGLSLKNVKIKIVARKKLLYDDFGEMLFTHFGVSGPTILSASAILLRQKNLETYLKNNEVKLKIDLKPALSEEKLDFRIRRDFEEYHKKQFKNSLDKLLPQKLIPVIIKKSEILPDKKISEISKEERKKLVAILKNLEFTIQGFRDIEEAIVTAGGISVKEIDPKTMQSKLVNGLYFAGELIDVDAYTGGFNLQIAYSTGYTAGKN